MDESTPNRYVSSLSDNELSDLRIIILLGCSSGLSDSDGNNFLDAMYEKGAQFVLGTYDVTYTHNNNAFLTYLLNAFKKNSTTTIGEAIKYANTQMKAETGYSGIYLPSYGMHVMDSPVIYKGNLNCRINY